MNQTFNGSSAFVFLKESLSAKMFYALRVKIFCSLSELELLKLKNSFPFFLGGGGDLQCLLELVLQYM